MSDSQFETIRGAEDEDSCSDTSSTVPSEAGTSSLCPPHFQLDLRAKEVVAVEKLVSFTKRKYAKPKNELQHGEKPHYITYGSNAIFNELAKKAAQEPWGNQNRVLHNYIFLTLYYIFKHEDETKDQQHIKTYKSKSSKSENAPWQTFAVFNTGLYTANNEGLYGILKWCGRGCGWWFFHLWSKKTEAGRIVQGAVPNRFQFLDAEHKKFQSLDDTKEIQINREHILLDNWDRIKEFIGGTNEDEMRWRAGMLLDGLVEHAKRLCEQNYKTPALHYYKGKVQLLLPLYFKPPSADRPLVLALTLVFDDTGKELSHYAADTILTADMAYQNARLIAKPQNDWLKLSEATTVASDFVESYDSDNFPVPHGSHKAPHQQSGSDVVPKGNASHMQQRVERTGPFNVVKSAKEDPEFKNMCQKCLRFWMERKFDQTHCCHEYEQTWGNCTSKYCKNFKQSKSLQENKVSCWCHDYNPKTKCTCHQIYQCNACVATQDGPANVRQGNI